MSVTRANVLVGIGDMTVDTVSVGSTHGGVTAEKNQTVFEKKVDQVRDAIALYPTDTKVTVKTNIAEATLENLKNIWNESVTINSSGTARTLQVGIPTSLTEHALVFNGKSPEGYNRTYSLYKAVSVNASQHAITKDGMVVFPVEFRIVPDLTKAAGQEYGTIVDYAA